MSVRIARFLGPLGVYIGEFPFEVTTVQAYNLKYFVSTPFSPDQANRGPWDTEVLRYEVHRGFVRFSFDRRCVQPEY